MTESEDTGRVTRLVEMGGRHIVVRQLKDTQVMLMAKEAQLITRKDIPNQRKLVGVTRLMEILESAIVQESDRDFVTDLNVQGKLELSDLLTVLTSFSDEKTDEKPVVRRGRPRKTAV
jgi:hypothetical protein